jgi:hypothetical protein
MGTRFKNHAALPHFSRGPRPPRFTKPGLKSTQKSPLTLPAISGLRTNWDKFGSAQERISRRGIPFKDQALQKLAPAGKTVTRFKAGDALLTFLASL